MDIRVETISVEKAKLYLQFNVRNRVLRRSLISQYARDMASGEWKLTHQGIAFGVDGTLLDGQHRLEAIIESGVAVEMVVARGVEDKTQLVMDDHARRSVSDAVSLASGERVTRIEVSIVRAAVELGGNTTSSGFGAKRTRVEMGELLSQFRGALDFASSLTTSAQRGVTAAPAWGAIALAWFYANDLDRLRLFCRQMVGSEMVSDEGDRASQLLREWLLRTGVRYGAQRSESFRKTQRAIVAFMKHQKVEKLYGTGVYYPFPLVDPVR